MILKKDIQIMIEKNTIAFATINKDGTPHNIAVCCVKIKGDRIIITDNYMKIAMENVLKNPNVSLVVFDKKEGYRINGKANYYNRGSWLKFVKSIRKNKGYPGKGAIVVKINEIRKLS